MCQTSRIYMFSGSDVGKSAGDRFFPACHLVSPAEECKVHWFMLVDQGWLRCKRQSATPTQQFHRLTWNHFTLRLFRLHRQICVAHAQLDAGEHRSQRCSNSGEVLLHPQKLNHVNSCNCRLFSWVHIIFNGFAAAGFHTFALTGI